MVFARLIAGLSLASVSACSLGTEPEARAVVMVDHDVIAAALRTSGGVRWLQLEIPITIRNTGKPSLEYLACGSTLNAYVRTGWREAWAPICTGLVGERIFVPPGESRAATIHISAAVEGPGGPVWQGAAGIVGTYRVSVALVPAGRGGPIPKIESNFFTLTVAP